MSTASGLSQEATLTALALIRKSLVQDDVDLAVVLGGYASQAGCDPLEALGALIGTLASLGAAAVQLSLGLETGRHPSQVSRNALVARMDVIEMGFLKDFSK
jgi:hypothetical protein